MHDTMQIIEEQWNWWSAIYEKNSFQEQIGPLVIQWQGLTSFVLQAVCV